MVVEFDSNKSGENQRLRGLSFELVTEFDFQNALVVQDQRKDYGEKRWQAIGMLNNRLHVVVFTLRGLAIRVINGSCYLKKNLSQRRKDAKERPQNCVFAPLREVKSRKSSSFLVKVATRVNSFEKSK